MWFVANKLTLTVQKTKYILFHRRQKGVNFEFKLSFGSLEIDRVTELRFLGVTIDDCLLWRPHINIIVTKMAKFISIFYKIINSVNRGSLILSFNSLIYLHLTYCNKHCVVHWSKNIIGFNSQNTVRIVRILTFSNRREHSAPLFKSCNMLKILIDIWQAYLCTDPCSLQGPFVWSV